MKKFFSFLCALTIVLSASAAPLKSVKAANQVSFKKSLNVEALAASGLAKQAKAFKAAKLASFDIEVSNITFNSAHIAIAPSDAQAAYVFDFAPASELEEYTDAELAKEIIDYYKEYIIENYGEEYLSLLPYLFSEGNFEKDFNGLTANTEYVVFAFYVDEAGNMLGNMAKKSFTTEHVTPHWTMDLTMTGGEVFVYDFGAWKFWAEDEYASVSIVSFKEEVAGSYKVSDLSVNYSYIGLMVGTDTTWYALSDANIEVAVDGANVTITGPLVGMNENNDYDIIEFRLNLAGVIYSEEQGIENIELTKEAKKVEMDGKVFIIRDEKLFDLRGAQVR